MRIRAILSAILIAIIAIEAFVLGAPHIQVSTGDSMEATIPAGTSIVLCDPVENVSNEIEVGDIVIWKHGGSWPARTTVLHRVVALNPAEDMIVTQGDAVARRDRPVPFDAVTCQYVDHIHVTDVGAPRFQRIDLPDAFLAAFPNPSPISRN